MPKVRTIQSRASEKTTETSTTKGMRAMVKATMAMPTTSARNNAPFGFHQLDLLDFRGRAVRPRVRARAAIGTFLFPGRPAPPLGASRLHSKPGLDYTSTVTASTMGRRRV